VDHSLLVRRLKPAGKLRAQPHHVLLRERALPKLLFQRRPDHELHHQEVDPFGRVEVEERGNVGVAQAREDHRLLAEAPPRLVVGQRTGGQDLEGDVPAQLLVPGPVHLAHAPGAEALLDAVVGEPPPDHADLPSRMSRAQSSAPVKEGQGGPRADQRLLSVSRTCSTCGMRTGTSVATLRAPMASRQGNSG
jgi:hypothetical protein